MEQIITKVQDWVVWYGPKIIAAVVIFIIGRIVAGIVRSVLGKLLRRGGVDEILISFVCSISYVAIMAFTVIASLERLGVATSSFVVVIGAAGLAIGFALQGSLSNFAAGVLLVIFKPFKIGDFISAAGTDGTVEEMGIFTTVLKSPDNKKIIIPNGKLTGDNIVNFSAKEQRRVDMVACVGYNDDLDKVRKILEAIVAEDDRMLKDPAPTIAVSELADSSVNFVVRPWVKTADYWGVYFDTQEKIKKRFDAEGVSIPYPQQDIHLSKVE